MKALWVAAFYLMLFGVMIFCWWSMRAEAATVYIMIFVGDGSSSHVEMLLDGDGKPYLKANRIFEDRHFDTRIGCEAVAHTINRQMEARSPKGDPGLYATCVLYEASDET